MHFEPKMVDGGVKSKKQFFFVSSMKISEKKAEEEDMLCSTLIS